jgi:WD40 repeat protein
VLIVDQLEELFTLVEDDAVRIHVLGMIERAVRDPGSRLRVVVTLRADFYDRPLLYRGFAELLRDGVVTVAPLSPDEIERAIAAPALGAGVVLEHGLLAEIVADVLDEPGALPLLQYALTELFERREDATLTRVAYAAIGGVSGALARRADELYAGLRRPEPARQLFLQLVTPGEAADTRRRVERAELESLDVDQGALAECIDVFGASRLLSFDRDPRSGRSTVEIAHEALLTQWGRLREWIDAARDDVRMQQRLAAAAAGWDESGRDPSFLLRGSRLTGFESWVAVSGLAQTELDRAYLTASLQERQAERTAEESRRAREAALERRSVNRLRAVVAVLATAAAVAAGLTVFAFDQSSRSERAADLAEARELAAASVANLDVDPELSILLARQAVRKAEREGRAPSEAADALHQAVATSRVLLTIRDPATTAAAFSPDGSRIATAGATRTQAYLWDAHTGKRLLTFKATAPIHNVAFSPDGNRLATSSEDGDAILWNSRTGRRLVVLPHLRTSGAAPAVAFSRDGRLGTVDQAGRVRIWDVRRRRLVRMIQAPYGLCGIAWSRDGTRIGAGHCAGSFTRAGRVWDAGTGRLLFRTSKQLEAVFAVDLSPDGRHVATGGYDGVTRIWDLQTNRLVAGLRGHAGAVLALAYSPDGALLATSGTDATARVWDARSGVQLLVLHGHSAGIGSLAFSSDGRLVTASEDGTARVWDVTPEGGRDWLTLVTNGGGVEFDSLVYSRDGARLFGTSIEEQPSIDRVSTAHVWNARTGALLRSYPTTVDGGWGLPASYSPEGRRHIFIPTTTSPDGTIAAVAVTDGSGASTGAVELYETSSGEQKLLATLAGRHRGLQDIEFDVSGKLVATGYGDGTAIVWDVASGRALHTFAAHNGVVESVAFSPDGTLLATAGDGTTAKLWDLETERRLLTLRGHTGALTDLEFSPDGSRLATGSLDGTIRVYVLPVEELMKVSLARLTRGWSVAECARYLPGGRCPPER